MPQHTISAGKTKRFTSILVKIVPQLLMHMLTTFKGWVYLTDSCVLNLECFIIWKDSLPAPKVHGFTFQVSCVQFN